MENENQWVPSEGKNFEEIVKKIAETTTSMENIPDPSKMEEQMKKVEAVIKEKLPYNNFDDSDISLLRILKNKLVRGQYYDLAAQLRDIEKAILTIIDDQQRREQEGKLADQKESLSFGEFLLKNFTACHWYKDSAGTVTEDMKIFGYVKNDDPTDRTYSTEEVYSLFLMNKV